MCVNTTINFNSDFKIQITFLIGTMFSFVVKSIVVIEFIKLILTILRRDYKIVFKNK